eukprot:CAMPEP_0206063510 /NCGR_PEP_ID=MMETSP1466-20131121/58267_1 /ASSEMBLY_ACC=CAM_ASM_001126 /TAXON_ID=44452 /ORGANISM="Pavlova gyrans, Strain CCMP608" /LENGTH=63 /DNA_ID=CAMNT_0053438879 /DNA_START=644 /DNA_END=835 /DNA_ORIENTATION=+
MRISVRNADVLSEKEVVLLQLMSLLTLWFHAPCLVRLAWLQVVPVLLHLQQPSAVRSWADQLG